jgi:hypothetical protein
MLVIWTAKNYSENENRNSMGMDRTMNTTPYCKTPYIILNKYGYRFTWIRFEDSLRLFMEEGTIRLKG